VIRKAAIWVGVAVQALAHVPAVLSLVSLWVAAITLGAGERVEKWGARK
jgi:hypothetical protein